MTTIAPQPAALGYLNRRINLTLLHGRREAAAKESDGA
jgi:hypothetical protein